jgi:N-acetylneuraminate synthase
LTIPDFRRRLDVHVGLSDHTITNTASIVATALGAVLIEKHFILDRNDKGPDSSFSIEPDEFEALVNQTKDAAAALGAAGYERKPAEEASIKFRRSLYFVKDMEKGELITKDCIRRIRPGYGCKPKYIDRIVGLKVKKKITKGNPVVLKDIE